MADRLHGVAVLVGLVVLVEARACGGIAGSRSAALRPPDHVSKHGRTRDTIRVRRMTHRCYDIITL